MTSPAKGEIPNNPGESHREMLVCFAVRTEVGKTLAATGTRVLVTGMGQRNAEASLLRELAIRTPAAVLTCGFAGALNPELALGDVLFSHDPELTIADGLLSSGARPGRFRLTQQVVVRAEEKALLHSLTGADAVEMESIAIRAICRKRGIPSATIRVILDTATEDLPVDFNRLMTGSMTLSYPRLFWQILRQPGLIRGLRKLQHDAAVAADRLDKVLARLLGRGS